MTEDWADFEIISEPKADNKSERRLAVRCIAEIDGEGYLQEDIVLVCPASVNTPNKLTVHVNNYLVSVWFDSLRYKEPEITECPNCIGVPLQNGECMVCGFKVTP